jgi:hypothetical protein
MHCPNCGKETFADQQFCRSCGTGLTDDARRPFNPQAWGLFALMLIFGGLLVAMGGKIWAVKWVIFTGLVIMFGGVFCIAAYGLLRQSTQRKSNAKRKTSLAPPQQSELVPADTTNKLLPIGDNDFIPSVVDNTTELLQTPAAREVED